MLHDADIFDKVRLHHDPVAIEPAVDELAAGELGERNKPMHMPGPDVIARRMLAQAHGGQCRGKRTAIAPAQKRNRLVTVYAGFAHRTIAQEQGIGAQQPIVMQGLHHRQLPFCRPFVHCGGEQRKEIVDMNDIGAIVVAEALYPNLALGIVGNG